MAQRLVREFREEYAETFAEVGDETKARELTVQRIGRVWGVSEMNSGALMRFPPEKAYPTINGSHDWLAKQLDDDIRAVLRIDAPNAGLLADRGFHPKTLTTEEIVRAHTLAKAPRMLISDARTDAETQAGQPPSYPIVLQAPNGMFVPMQDAQGRQLRFRGSLEAAMKPARVSAETELALRAEAAGSRAAWGARDARRWGRQNPAIP